MGIFGVIFLKPTKSNLVPLSLNSILNGTFSDKSINPVWDSDGNYYFIKSLNDSRRAVFIGNPTEGRKGQKILIHPDNFVVDNKNYTISSMSFSPDFKKVLFPTKVQSIWRHSFTAEYILYDLATNASTYITKDRIMNAIWSPDSTKIAYVKDRDIYIYDVESESTTRVTTTESKDISNGVMAWVYEEEVFSQSIAMWWSHNGEKLAYIVFNETEVDTRTIPLYKFSDDGFVENFEYKYPAAGRPNPKVGVDIYDLESESSFSIDVYDYEDVEYITGVYWDYQSSDRIFIRVLNRRQNFDRLIDIDLVAADSKIVSLQVSTDSWVDIKPLHFVDSGTFLSIIEHPDNRYFHIYIFKSATKSPLTSGEFDVLSIESIDTTNKRVYFISNEHGRMEKRLYYLNYGSTELKRVPIVESEGVYSMSVGKTHTIFKSHGPDVPQQFIIDNNDFKNKVVIEENAHIINETKKYKMPKKEYFTIKVNNRTLNVYMIKPPNFSEGSEYAALFNLYGGPTSITVTKQHTLGFNEFISSALDIVVVNIDNVGTGGQGHSFSKTIYKKAGLEETKDQIEGIKYILKNNKYIDPKRVGLWGWSYGGFMTLNVAFRGEGILYAAAAVAPVTDWRLYDSAYTERYMLTPSENLDGYKNTSLIEYVKVHDNPLNRTNLLLIHGIYDDNVRLEHSSLLSEELVKKNVPFEQFYYTNQDHSISANGARYHIYQKIYDFFDRKLKGVSPDLQ